MAKYKFNFSFDLQDTENFLGIIQNNIVDAMSKKLEAYPSAQDWWDKHIAYLKEMQTTITNGMTRTEPCQKKSGTK
jgi:hypothetical protein